MASATVERDRTPISACMDVRSWDGSSFRGGRGAGCNLDGPAGREQCTLGRALMPTRFPSNGGIAITKKGEARRPVPLCRLAGT